MLSHNKTLVSNMQASGGIYSLPYKLVGADCGTPTGTGSHSQTKYYYIANSKLAKQRVFYNSYLIILAVSFNLYLIKE